ncbi:iron-containing alcohol dehydrogenase [Kitasatospora sp. NPDC096128]|uniref:iron-containing alcohol dehydrogenase n=1 Tax=Kitasatospora sp. NPDC096128 TaxID=3155547 RepID=UPI00333363F5
MLSELVRLPGHPSAHFGQGAAGRLPEVLEALAASRVLVVGGRGSFGLSGAAELVRGLERDHRIRCFIGSGPNPTLETVEEGLAVAREFAPDVVVGVGGGSSMDLAKAVAVLARQPRRPLDYLRDPELLEPDRLGLVLLPTTSGSGSELTRFATIYVDGRKHSLDSELSRADAVLVDPRLTESVPLRVGAAAGADALCQAVESCWAVSATPESLGYARQAVGSLVPALDRLVGGTPPYDREVYEGLALGAALSGAAINLTRTTAGHALSYGLTARAGIPHGLAVALHMRWLIGHNSAAGEGDCLHPDGPAVLRGLIDDLQSMCARSTGDSLEGLLGRLLERGGSPSRLAGLGLDAEDWAADWQQALGTVRGGNNPRAVTPDDVRKALEE